MRPGKLVDQALAGADLIIAADSGARAAIDIGTFPDAVIGDFDSLDQEAQDLLEQKGCQFVVHDSAKDQTDTELAVQYAIDHSATMITIIGGIEGDRIDHILANIFLVMDFKIPVKFVNGLACAWLQKGPAAVKISGASDDLLSLIPLTPEVTKVETNYLKYSLGSETLRQTQARGISNVLVKPEAIVTFQSGTLLFVHTATSV